MGIDRQPEDPEPTLKVVLPDRLVPVSRTALQDFPAPDIVHQYIDAAVVLLNPVGQPLQFGAEIYVANLVTIGMAREMGAMMTAIVMAEAQSDPDASASPTGWMERRTARPSWRAGRCGAAVAALGGCRDV